MSKTNLNKKRTVASKGKSDEELLAESAILKAGQVKNLVTEIVKKNLTEQFAPSVRQAINNSVDSDFDFEDELEEDTEVVDDEMDVEGTEEVAEVETDDVPSEEEIETAEGDDDVEMAEESEDLFEEEDAEEGFEDETFEEATDEEAEFLAELEKLIESEGAYEDEEMENMDEDYDEWSSERVQTNTSNKPRFVNESEEGDEDDDLESMDEDYNEWTSERVQTNTSNQPRFVNESRRRNSRSRASAPAKKLTREEALIKENKTLRSALRKNMSTLDELSLDLTRNNEFHSLVESFTKLKPVDKLNIMEALDRGNSVREIKNISESLRKVYSRTMKENSKGAIAKTNRTAPKKEGRSRLLAGKTDLQVKKSAVKESSKTVKKENTRTNVVDKSLFDNFARLAGIQSE